MRPNDIETGRMAAMRVGVVGINYKLADLKLRERLAKACQKRFGACQSIHNDHYFVVLSTCNRTEVYFSSEDLAASHSYLLSILRQEVEEEFNQKLYSYFGVDCFSHLTKVAAGLDSAILAETEIQGQVKVAYESSLEFATLPKDLHFLFQKSLGIAKKIRTDLQLGRGMPDLEHAILHTGKSFFSSPGDAKILLVGASDINQKILAFLKDKQLSHLTLCNRSDKKAHDLVAKYGIQFLEWAQFKSWINYDWIIFGTKSPDYLVSKENTTPQLLSKKLVMDLSVPRNVDPRLVENSSISLFNIDQINQLLKIRRYKLTQMVIEAEDRIMQATHEHSERYLQRNQSRIHLMACSA